MAWKTPAGQRKPPKQQAQKNGVTAFPRLASPGLEANKKTQYEELQQNEVMVLQAIYGDDFTEHTATHSAWKV
jgi:translation initiation factor 2-alpha kinase 4